MLEEGRPPLRLEHRLTDERGNAFRTHNAEVPEFMIAVAETDVRAMHEKAGLDVVTPVGWVFPRSQDTQALEASCAIAIVGAARPAIFRRLNCSAPAA